MKLVHPNVYKGSAEETDKNNRLAWNTKIEVKVNATRLLQQKQELPLTQLKARKAVENRAKKTFALSKGT